MTVVVTVLAVVLSARQQALYQASGDVSVKTKDLESSAGEVQTGSDPERVLETEATAAARGAEVVDQALVDFPSRRGDVDLFLARSTVTADPKANILIFSVTDPDRALAIRLTTAYAKAYISFRRKEDTAAFKDAQLAVRAQLRPFQRQTATVRAASPVYSELSGQLADLSIRERQLDNIASIGRPAREAIQVQPHPLRNGILGGVLGLMLGIGIALTRDQLNSRVRTVGDMEELLDLPLLGRLYEPPRSLRSRDALAMMATPDAPESEAFQILATNIEFANLERGAKSFMIASANPSEGKSTTIANLAVTFARSGKRVVLVDLDLRRPVLHRFFDLQGTPGITDVTLGRAWLEEALVQVPLGAAAQDEHANGDGQLGGTLELLPAGPLPPNAAEFVRSQALSDVLARLMSRADLVFVDAPAMLAVSDAINLTPKVDALIVLARLPAVKTAALKELERILANAPVTRMGFIVTGAESDDTFSGGYGYGYGYGSGSGIESEKSPKTPSLS
ncbi:MAG: polysaccharide biosynthesis tyrosine autokinase [Solirubrobacteraceae bacterium]